MGVRAGSQEDEEIGERKRGITEKGMREGERSMRRGKKRKHSNQVLSGTRLIRSEGLTQDDLVKNKHGKVVSKKKSTLGTKIVE